MADIGWTTEFVKKFFELYGIDDFGLYYLDQDNVDGDTLSHSMDDVLAILGITDPAKVASIEREWSQIVSLDLIPQIALKNIKPTTSHLEEHHHDDLDDMDHVMARTFDFTAVDNFVLESNSAKLAKQENKIEHLSQKLTAMSTSESNTNALINNLRREINDLHLSSIKDKRDKLHSEEKVKKLLEEVEQLKVNSPKDRVPPTVYVEGEAFLPTTVDTAHEKMNEKQTASMDVIVPTVVAAVHAAPTASAVVPISKSDTLINHRVVTTEKLDDEVLIHEHPLSPAVDVLPLLKTKTDKAADKDLQSELNELMEDVFQQTTASVASLSSDDGEDAELDAQYNLLIAAATQSKNTKMVQYLFDKNNRRSIRKSLRVRSTIVGGRGSVLGTKKVEPIVNTITTETLESVELINANNDSVVVEEAGVGPVKSQYENEEDMRWFTGYKPVAEGTTVTVTATAAVGGQQQHLQQPLIPQPPPSSGANNDHFPNRPVSAVATSGRPHGHTAAASSAGVHPPLVINTASQHHQRQYQQVHQQQLTPETPVKSHAYRITDHIKQMYDNIDDYYQATELNRAKVLQKQQRLAKENRDKKNLQNKQWFHDPKVLYMPAVADAAGRPVSASAVHGSRKQQQRQQQREHQQQLQQQAFERYQQYIQLQQLQFQQYPNGGHHLHQHQPHYQLQQQPMLPTDARLFSAKEKCYAEHISDLVHIIDDLTLANNKIIKSMIQANVINTNAQLLSANINMLQFNEQPLFPQRPAISSGTTQLHHSQSASQQFRSRTHRIKHNTDPYSENDYYHMGGGGGVNDDAAAAQYYHEASRRWTGDVRDSTEIYEPVGHSGGGLHHQHLGVGRYPDNGGGGGDGMRVNEFLLQEELSSLLDSDDYIFPASQQVYQLNNDNNHYVASSGGGDGNHPLHAHFQNQPSHHHHQLQQSNERFQLQHLLPPPQDPDQNSSDLSNSRKEPVAVLVVRPQPPSAPSHSRGRAVTAAAAAAAAGAPSHTASGGAGGGVKAARKTVPSNNSNYAMELNQDASLIPPPFAAVTENTIQYRVDSALNRGALLSSNQFIRLGDDTVEERDNRRTNSTGERRPQSATAGRGGGGGRRAVERPIGDGRRSARPLY